MWNFDQHMNCNYCQNKLDAKKSSYWVVPGSGCLTVCETCFSRDNINYIHTPTHYINGVCDKKE